MLNSREKPLENINKIKTGFLFIYGFQKGELYGLWL